MEAITLFLESSDMIKLPELTKNLSKTLFPSLTLCLRGLFFLNLYLFDLRAISSASQGIPMR
jgi:hypothetical protein